MKLPIRPNQTDCWLKLFVAFVGLSLIPQVMGKRNCTGYCLKALCSLHNGTEGPEHANCLKENLNCNCSWERNNAAGNIAYLLAFYAARIVSYCVIGNIFVCTVNTFTDMVVFLSTPSPSRPATTSTPGGDPDTSMNSQLSDSQTGSPRSSSAPSIVIPMDETQFPAPDAADLPPEYLHPPQYPSPPEYTSHVVDVDERESRDKQHANAKELNHS